MSKILIIEDDRRLAELLQMHLEDLGHEVITAGDIAAGDAQLQAQAPDAVLLDQQLPDGTGLALLRGWQGRGVAVPVIMITGVSDTAVAIEATQLGAYDFIRKPMDEAELDTTLANALAAYRLSRRFETVVEQEAPPVSIASIIGNSRAVLEVCKTIGRVARTDATVLITGESGTGKEVVARAIHHHSGRPGVFLPVNCSAIVETLLESELFGHEKGAYTGAVGRREGRFELASDGTLFLDEIGEMPLGSQAKLLRVLQERQFERVGGTQRVHTNARLVAATNRDLLAMARDGSFREDLYYRLNVITLHLPPLRERPEDIPPLVEHLLKKINRDLHKAVTRVSKPAWQLLRDYPWPGNVRELENVLTRAVVLASQDVLTPELLGLGAPAAAAPDAGAPAELLSLDQLEERHIRAILAHTRWHKGRACEILGISRPALERKIVKYGIR